MNLKLSSKQKFYLAIIVLNTIFIILYLFIKISYVEKIDQQITLFFYNNLNNDYITNFFLIITNYTIGTFFGVAFVEIIFFSQKRFQIALIFILSVVFLVLFNTLIKLIVQRPRPFITLIKVRFLGDILPLEFSFPSGHSLIAFFIAYFVTKIFKLNKSLTLMIYILAIVVAFSRIYLGAHYLIDIIAGSILGTLGGVLSLAVLRFINYENY